MYDLSTFQSRVTFCTALFLLIESTGDVCGTEMVMI